MWREPISALVGSSCLFGMLHVQLASLGRLTTAMIIYCGVACHDIYQGMLLWEGLSASSTRPYRTHIRSLCVVSTHTCTHVDHLFPLHFKTFLLVSSLDLWVFSPQWPRRRVFNPVFVYTSGVIVTDFRYHFYHLSSKRRGFLRITPRSWHEGLLTPLTPSTKLAFRAQRISSLKSRGASI